MSPPYVRRVYMGLGSNLGDRLAHLQFALDELAARAGSVVAVSSVYETTPVGGGPQPDYLNAAIALDSSLSARRLLEVAKSIEATAGREPAGRNEARPLDIDVLMVGEESVEEDDLVVPHPRMHERAFVLAPLADVAHPPISSPSAGWTGVRRMALQLKVPE